MMGVVKCVGSKNKSSGSIPECVYGDGNICSNDNSKYHVGGFSTKANIDNNVTFMFEPTSNVKDGQYIYYGDYVRVIPQYTKFKESGDYYLSASDCSDTTYAAKIESQSNPDFQTYKITTPPGSKSIDGTPVYNSSLISIKMETADSSNMWNNTYLYYDTVINNTGGWVWQYPASSSESQQTLWSIITTYNPGGCNRPDPSDENMFHAEGTEYGDVNYGEVKSHCTNTIQGPPSAPSGMKNYQIDGKNAACGMGLCLGDFAAVCDLFGQKTELFPGAACGVLSPCGCGSWTSCPTVNWAFINEWKDQTETQKNQVMCCGGLWTSSNDCHPYYCPKNTGDFNINDNDGGSCPSVMANACTSDNWSKAYTDPTSDDAYIGLACDSYISEGDQTAAEAVAQSAVNDFYISNGHSPTDDHPFVRKAVDLCNKYPGMCDSIFTQVCSAYTADDLDSKQYAGRKYDPEGTNLLDTCGCFLNSDQYLCYDKDGNYDPNCKGGTGSIGRTCNTVCNFPNSVKPYDSSTGGPEQCGGTTCVISDVTFNEINSTGGAFSINQVCNSSGDPPYICYLGGIDINANKGSIGNVQISENCEKCFLFDPNDPSKPPEEIDCNISSAPSPPPTVETTVFRFLKVNQWWVVGVAVIIAIIVILFMFYVNKK